MIKDCKFKTECGCELMGECRVCPYEDFGAFLQYSRCQKGITQEDISKSASVTISAVHMWEHGINIPATVNLPTIAESYGIDLNIILELLNRDFNISKLAVLVRSERKRLGMSVQEFCDIVGVNNGNLSNWECGARRIPSDYIPGIAKALNIPFFTLMDVYSKDWMSEHEPSMDEMMHDALCRYPFNLLQVVSGRSGFRCLEYNAEKLTEAVKELPKKHQYIIYRRYCCRDTLQDIGKTVGLTRERVRQIEVKAIQMLKSSIMSEDTVSDLRVKLARLQGELAGLKGEVSMPVKHDIRIEDMGFSPRPLHILKRNGVATLEDLRKTDMSAIYDMKGMGIKSINEIVKVAESFGIKFDATDR